MAPLVDRIKGMTVNAVKDAPAPGPVPQASVAVPAFEQDDAPIASPEERIEFLKHSIAFTESTIRAYDTKSQIAMAAFVVSMNPLWSILNATCTDVAQRPIVAVLLCAFIATILVYCFVLWPIRPLQDLVRNVRAKGLFYIHDPKTASSTYSEKLKELSVEPEFTAEVLKLSFIRARKGRRLKYALWATGAFYAFVFISFLMLRQCT
jgi:hypothetical protein